MICATLSGSTSASTAPAPRRSSRCDSWRASAGSNSLVTASREHAEVGRLGAQLERAGLELRQVEQVGRELLQPLDLLAQLGEERLARLGVEVLVLEQLEEAAEREDRRAQLVRGGGDEALARRVELAELALHVVERDRELAELVVGSTTKRPVRSPRGDAPRGALEALDPLRRGASASSRPAASASSSAIAPATRIRLADERRRCPRRRSSGAEKTIDALDVAAAQDRQRRLAEPAVALASVPVAMRRWRAASAATSNCRSAGASRRSSRRRPSVCSPSEPRLTRSSVTRALARSPARATIRRSGSIVARRARATIGGE